MRIAHKALIGAVLLASTAVGVALAQGVGSTEIAKASVNDPPGPAPDPAHIPFFHPEDAETESAAVARSRFLAVESAAVVADRDADIFGGPVDIDGHARSLSVLGDVCQSLLGHPIEH